MKSYFFLTLIAGVLLFSGIAYATATRETGDTRARPVVLYGKTASGTLVPFRTAEDGTLQVV